MNGRHASLEDFLNPDILDTLGVKITEVLEVTTCLVSCLMHTWVDTESSGVHVDACLLVQEVNQVSPGKPVWLGETSSAYGGGAAGLSDTFAAGFM